MTQTMRQILSSCINAPMLLKIPWRKSEHGDMEARIVLEGKVDRLGEDTAAIRAVLKQVNRQDRRPDQDVAEAKGRLNAMPSSWQLIGLIVGVFGLAFALIKVTAP